MKNALFVFSAIVILAMSACSKGNSSIVGTWSPSTLRLLTQVDHVTVSDTTYSEAGHVATISFLADGRYMLQYSLDSGTYAIASGVLTTVSEGSQGTSVSRVNSLTDHSMVLDKIDTPGVSPVLTIRQVINTYTR